MSSATKNHPPEKPVGLQRHHVLWGIVAFIVCIAFFSIWTLGNYGTPANPGMPDPAVNNPPVTAPGVNP